MVTFKQAMANFVPSKEFHLSIEIVKDDLKIYVDDKMNAFRLEMMDLLDKKMDIETVNNRFKEVVYR
jgi:hypothetical protein